MLKINKILSKKIKSPLSLRGAKRRSNLKGFSLIELMVAVAILAVAIFGIFHAYSAGFMGMADSRDRTVATNYAREAMEDIKNKDFDQIVTQSRYSIDGTKYEREVIVQKSTNLKKVTTKVYWKDRNGTWKTVETDMVIHFIETTAGTPTKIILYADPYNILTEDESLITAIVKDDKGNTVTTWDKNINFSHTGSGSLSSSTVLPVNFVNGKAIITFTSGTVAEEVIITASSVGLTSDSVIIKITDPEEPVKIKLTNSISEEETMFMTPGSISIVTATIVDAAGDTVTEATNEITFSVSGPGTLSNQQPLALGVVEITLTSNGTPGTITITASSTGLEPGIINVYTGGWIYLTASPINVPVSETSLITVITKDMNGVPIKFIGTIDLSIAGDGTTPGFGSFPSSPYPVVFNGESSSETVIFTAITIGDVKITSEDSETSILTPENYLILTVIPELNPDHIKVDANPSNIPVGGNDTSTITARVEDEYYTPITSYTNDIEFTTTAGSFSFIDDTVKIITLSDVNENYNDGVATVELYSDVEPETADISVTSVYYGETISGNTRVGFYYEADHIDLIAIPQSILTGGGSEGTCTIIATIKDGAIVVSGYNGTVTFTIEEGYPNGVKFTSTNQSSITISVVNGMATIDLQSKNWVGTAIVSATAIGLSEIPTEYLDIPVVTNKNLEIFLLYKNELNGFKMDYYNPEDGSFEGEWIPENIVYGKFCVDSDNNLYILDGSYIQKKSSRGELIPTYGQDTTNSYTINIGPNGYIYFTQRIDFEDPTYYYRYCIKKLNPNTLEIEDILNLNEDILYYGFTVDSDGDIYIHNYTGQKIEKWNFTEGFTGSFLNLDYNYEFSELAIAENYIGGIGVEVSENVRKAFITPKNFSSAETEFTSLNGSLIPFYISSIGGDFLFSGLNNFDEVVFGRYYTDCSLQWLQTINDNVYSDCIIGAYPF